MSLLKKLTAPMQAKILDNHMCPACTRSLDKLKTREPITTETEIVTCECGRKFIYNRSHRKYRRALMNEIRTFKFPVLNGA